MCIIVGKANNKKKWTLSYLTALCKGFLCRVTEYNLIYDTQTDHLSCVLNRGNRRLFTNHASSYLQ